MKSKKVIILILVIFIVFNISIQINNYAVDFISNQKERSNGFLIGSEPYETLGNPDITILLIHGTSSSPKDFREISNFLASKDISTKTILLPGHGTSPKDLATKKYQDWVTAIEKEFNKIESKNKFVLGYSLGGTLALDLSENKNLNGVIGINSPIFLQTKFAPFIPLLKLVEKYHVAPPETIILIRKEERSAYDAIPLATIEEINKLVQQLNLKKVTEPTLIIQTNNDTLVNPKSANFIYNEISSKNKNILWLEDSTHEDPDETEEIFIYNEIYNFIKENSKP